MLFSYKTFLGVKSSIKEKSKHKTILTQFACSTNLPLIHVNAEGDPNGTKLHMAGYLDAN